jgi:HemK-like putative methylase
MDRIKDYIYQNLKDKKSIDICVKRFMYRDEPMSKILCFKPFWKWDFITNCDTLDPRPETEYIIEEIIKKYNKYTKLKIIDMGVGSGCILLSLLKIYPFAYGFGVDISEDALRISRINAARLQVSKRVRFIQSDWWQNVSEDYFDILVSNPPYLKDISGNLIYDPSIALLGDEGTYKKILEGNRFEECYLELPEMLYDKVDLNIYKHSYKNGILIASKLTEI